MTHICSQGESRQGKAYELIQFNFWRSWRSSKRPILVKEKEKTKKEDEWRRKKRGRVYRLHCFSPVTVILLILHHEMLITSTHSYLDRQALRSRTWNPLGAAMHDSAVFCCVAQDIGGRGGPPGEGSAVWSCSRHEPILVHLSRSLPCFVTRDVGRSSWQGT